MTDATGHESKRRSPLENGSRILLLCLVGSFATVTTYGVAVTLSLPETDPLYGSVFAGGPRLIPMMIVSAAVATAFIFPISYTVLLDKNLARCCKIGFPIVLSSVAILTPIAPPIGVIGSMISFAVALILCNIAGKQG